MFHRRGFGISRFWEVYLDPAIFRKLNTVVRNELVDLAVLVAFTLRVADEYDHLEGMLALDVHSCIMSTYSRFAHVAD